MFYRFHYERVELYELCERIKTIIPIIDNYYNDLFDINFDFNNTDKLFDPIKNLVESTEKERNDYDYQYIESDDDLLFD